jgi:hypothetical protein
MRPGAFGAILAAGIAGACSAIALIKWNLVHIALSKGCANTLIYAQMPTVCNNWHVHNMLATGALTVVLMASVTAAFWIFLGELD